jgi:hypothetical protein
MKGNPSVTCEWDNQAPGVADDLIPAFTELFEVVPQEVIWAEFAGEIHEFVWDTIGLDEVRRHISRWAKARSRKWTADRKKSTDDSYDLPPPPLPLPPDHYCPTMPEKLASLAAIHDAFWKCERINPWPKPNDAHDFSAWTKWLKDGLAFEQLTEQAGKLSSYSLAVAQRWLSDLRCSRLPKGPKA